MTRCKMIKCCYELSAKSSSYLPKLNSTFVDLAELMLSVRDDKDSVQVREVSQ